MNKKAQLWKFLGSIGIALIIAGAFIYSKFKTFGTVIVVCGIITFAISSFLKNAE